MSTLKHFRWIILITLVLTTFGSSVHAVAINTGFSNAPYSVSVGIFESYENAEKLVNIIKSNKYSPWIRSYAYNGETNHGVYLGAFESKDKAEEFAQSVRKKIPFITNYVIVELKQNQAVIIPSQIAKVTLPTINSAVTPVEKPQKEMQTSQPIVKDSKPAAKQKPVVQPTTQIAKKLNSGTQYAVRVGKFVNYENVKNLFSMLKSDNCDPWLKAYSYKGKITYWLYAGTFESKDKAEEFAQSMQKRLSYIDDYVIMRIKSGIR